MLCDKSSSLEQLAKTVVAKAAIVNNFTAVPFRNHRA